MLDMTLLTRFICMGDSIDDVAKAGDETLDGSAGKGWISECGAEE